MRLRQFFLMHKSDRQMVLLLLGFALAGLLFLHFTDMKETGTDADTAQDSLQTAPRRLAQRRQTYVGPVEERPQPELFAFDPNTADSTQLLRLGLQPWQVRNVYKYRARGGIYRSKSDFQRLYGLTQQQFRQLEPYITISDDYKPAALSLKTDSARPDSARHHHKIAPGEQVDLATADSTVLMSVPGIGPYFARRILSYGRRLGGYVSVSQLQEIDDFPMESAIFFTIGTPNPTQLNLNQLSLNELKRHPYINYYQARAIIDYRRLHGPLHSLDDLRLHRDFDEEAIGRLSPYVTF